MSHSWKLRHENNNGFGEWEAPKFTGFASANEKEMYEENQEFLALNLKEWIKPFQNSCSYVQLNQESGVITIKVVAAQLDEKGQYESSKTLRFNYSNRFESLPNAPEYPAYLEESEQLAQELNIEYRR